MRKHGFVVKSDPVPQGALSDGARIVQPLDLSSSKNYVAFDPTELKPREEKWVSLFPFVTCRPYRLVVAPEHASDFRIMEIQVANVIIGWSNGNVPGTMFPPMPSSIEDVELAREMESFCLLNMPMITHANRLSLKVRNDADVKRVFSAMFWVKTDPERL